MLIVQKFHSIHEIDPEFVGNIEVLLQEETPHFRTLVTMHDQAPSTDVFTYFLFFGPTQNAPIGFAQLCLRALPGKDLIPWWKKLCFWNKDHEHWKEIIWKVGDGCHGLYVFDPKFARSGREKIQELIKEYENRDDIKAAQYCYLKGLQEVKISWPENIQKNQDSYILEPMHRSFKTYQDYSQSLAPEIQQQIRESWKKMHKDSMVELGDYSSATELPHHPSLNETLRTQWLEQKCQILTFQKESKILGCVTVSQGKNGNYFFEPFPFEPETTAIVPDELYTQYALLKFFELPDARKCHLMKFGRKLRFTDKEDIKFFEQQGFRFKTVAELFCSRLQALTDPL
jgi:hypothetical protein